MEIEVCCFNVDAAVVAADAGAERIELCSCRELDGISPEPQLLTSVLNFLRERRSVGKHCPKLHVMVRSVPLGPLESLGAEAFLLSSIEKHECLRTIRELGLRNSDDVAIDAIVCGSLLRLPSGNFSVDFPFMRDAVEAAHSSGIRDVTFHRAIDFVDDECLSDTVVRLQQVGVSRILTSGNRTCTDPTVRWLHLVEVMSTLMATTFTAVLCGGINSETITEFRASISENATLQSKFDFHGTFSGGKETIDTPSLQEALRSARALKPITESS